VLKIDKKIVKTMKNLTERMMPPQKNLPDFIVLALLCQLTVILVEKKRSCVRIAPGIK